MSKRERPKLTPTSYFVSEKPGINFVSSGCALLDCALGGGYAGGRMVNVVGDRSTAKTGLAGEAMTNFLLQYPKGTAVCRETEAAYLVGYAKAMGVPVEAIDFGDVDHPVMTVEDFARGFGRYLDTQIKHKTPGIYVLDSLNALSDEAEMDRDVGEATYGMAKAKMLSEFFRKTARRIEQSQVLLFVVSQVRENIGVTFGEKYRRAGGKALDFYASQIVWLSVAKPIKRTINKVERTIGVTIMAKVKKNKVGLPFREASFDYIFAFGVDDIGSSVRWLHEVGHLENVIGSDVSAKEYLAVINDQMTDAQYKDERLRLTKAVKQTWAEIETSFLPTRKKYA